MKFEEIMLQALSGKLTCRGRDILGWSPRRSGAGACAITPRLRWPWDRRRRTPSPRRVPVAEVERLLRLFRSATLASMAAFYDLVRRDHGLRSVTRSSKRALQGAGLLAKRRARGRHRRRPSPRPCFGELSTFDGSPHPWLASADARQTLIHGRRRRHQAAALRPLLARRATVGRHAASPR